MDDANVVDFLPLFSAEPGLGAGFGGEDSGSK